MSFRRQDKDLLEVSANASVENSINAGKIEGIISDIKQLLVPGKSAMRKISRRSSSNQKDPKQGGPSVGFQTPARGPQPVEKKPVVEFKHEEGIHLIPFKFLKAMQNTIYLWRVRFISRMLNKQNNTTTSYFRFDVSIRDDITLPFQVPVSIADDQQNMTSTWPKVNGGFIQWFINEKFEEAYRMYNKKMHPFIKDKILMSKLKFSKGGEKKLPKLDQDAIVEIKRRICFLIDRKLFIKKRPTGSVLCLAKDFKDLLYREFISNETEKAATYFKTQRDRLLNLPAEDLCNFFCLLASSSQIIKIFFSERHESKSNA